MRFVFTEEQRDLRTAVRAFLDKHSPETEVRRLMDTPAGFDQAVWNRLSQELGVSGLAVPEQFGGAGASPIEVGVVLEELGRSLACLPYLSSVWLAQAVLTDLAAADPDLAGRWLPGLASGELRGTVALDDPGSGRPGVTAVADGPSGPRLTGTAAFVLDGTTADLVLLYPETPDGPALAAVERDATGLDRRPVETLDPTRKLVELRFTDTPAELLLTGEAARASLASTRRIAAVGLAVEAVGGAQRVLDMAVEYAKVRHQFGRPIGSFQAVKHQLADVLVGVESARSAAHAALWAIDKGDPELPMLASLAKSHCAQVYRRAAATNIQVHGGIGFTWEHPAHLYLRRAKSTQLMFGDESHHRHRLASLAGLWLDESTQEVDA